MRNETKATKAQGLASLTGSASYMREQKGVKGLLKSSGCVNQISSAAAGNQGISNGLSTVYSPTMLYEDSFDESWDLDCLDASVDP
jgi:hypothetical protein